MKTADRDRTFTPLDYIAWCLYRRDCADKGFIGVLWGTMRHDLRNKYLLKANFSIDAWVVLEGECKTSRDAGNPRAYFDLPVEAP